MNPSPKYQLTPSFRAGRHAGWVKRIGRGQPMRWICSAAAAPTGEAADLYYEAHFADLASPPEPVADPADVTFAWLASLYESRARARVGAAVRGIAQRTVDEYHELLAVACETIGDVRHRDLTPSHFAALHAALQARYGLRRTSKVITIVRSVFKQASLPPARLQLPDYGGQFDLPSRKDRRLADKASREDQGVRAFAPAEIRAQLDGAIAVPGRNAIAAPIRGANPALRAMILLAINAGLGNSDLAELPFSVITAAADGDGWLEYWRGKTGAHRLAWLWPETIQAIHAYRDIRPRPKAAHAALFFVTPYGNPYIDWPKDHIALSYGRLMDRMKQRREGRNFYSLRRTYRSIAAEVGRERVIDLSMGHCEDGADMGAVYTVLELRAELVKVAQHVRQRVLG